MNLTIQRIDQLGQPLIEQGQPFVPYGFRVHDRRYLRICPLEVVIYHHVLVPANFPQLHLSDTRQLGAHIDYFHYLPPH